MQTFIIILKKNQKSPKMDLKWPKMRLLSLIIAFLYSRFEMKNHILLVTKGKKLLIFNNLFQFL